MQITTIPPYPFLVGCKSVEEKDVLGCMVYTYETKICGRTAFRYVEHFNDSLLAKIGCR